MYMYTPQCTKLRLFVMSAKNVRPYVWTNAHSWFKSIINSRVSTMKAYEYFPYLLVIHNVLAVLDVVPFIDGLSLALTVEIRSNFLPD